MSSSIILPIHLLQQALRERDDIQVMLCAQDVSPQELNDVIQDRIAHDDVEALGWLQVAGTESLLHHAVEANALEVVRQWLPRLSQEAWFSKTYALSKAVRRASTAMVDLVLSYAPASVHGNDAVLYAIQQRQLDMVKQLLPTANMDAKDQQIARAALRQVDESLLQLVLPYADVAATGNAIIQVERLTRGRSSFWWERLDRLGVETTPAQRQAWLAHGGDEHLPRIAEQVLSDLRLKTLDQVARSKIHRARARS